MWIIKVVDASNNTIIEKYEVKLLSSGRTEWHKIKNLYNDRISCEDIVKSLLDKYEKCDNIRIIGNYPIVYKFAKNDDILNWKKYFSNCQDS